MTEPGGAAAESERMPEAASPGVAAPVTGQARVDALLERLADADALPTEGHIEVYEEVHRGLREALAALDGAPVGSPRPEPGAGGPAARPVLPGPAGPVRSVGPVGPATYQDRS